MCLNTSPFPQRLRHLSSPPLLSCQVPLRSFTHHHQLFSSTVNSRRLRRSARWLLFLLWIFRSFAFVVWFFLSLAWLEADDEELVPWKMTDYSPQPMLFATHLTFLIWHIFRLKQNTQSGKKCEPGRDFIPWELIGSWTVGVLCQNGARSEYKFAFDDFVGSLPSWNLTDTRFWRHEGGKSWSRITHISLPI